MSATLFGESVGDHFDRGVSQYPTIGDAVHLVTQNDLRIIYSSGDAEKGISVGNIAASSGIPGRLDLGKMVSRHTAILGSTGAGKSNLVAVLLDAIASQDFPSSRVLVIDPHGEFGAAVENRGYVFKTGTDLGVGEKPLYVPYWALPFDELKKIALGDLQPAYETQIRDEITSLKRKAATSLKDPPPVSAVDSDSPVPFSIRRLWFELDDFERKTFNKPQGGDPCSIQKAGDAEKLISNEYPRPNPGGQAPHANPNPRRIGKQLELLKSRLLDERYKFLFQPGDALSPDLDGNVKGDMDALAASWIGHDRQITVLDVSTIPAEIIGSVVGTLLRLIYDLLFWGGELPISGKRQPLLVFLEEAHLFLPEGIDSPAHRIVTRIAKEGRKYGAGLCVVTQRPTEIDATVLSQCSTVIALRTANEKDRSKIQAVLPDDLGAMAGMLPSLRTGEGLVIGEAMPIPSRIQFFRASRKKTGEDPDASALWRKAKPEATQYALALGRWRHKTQKPTPGEKNNA